MEILSEQKLYPTNDKYHVCLMESIYKATDGSERKWHWARRKNDARAVTIVATVKGNEDRLVLIREFRVPLKKQIIALPAGLIEAGEDLAEAAKREIFEETGMTSVKSGIISPFLLSSPGLTNESAAIVFLDVIGELSNKNLEVSEEIEPFMVTKLEAMHLLSDAENEKIEMDQKVWLILMLFITSNK